MPSNNGAPALATSSAFASLVDSLCSGLSALCEQAGKNSNVETIDRMAAYLGVIVFASIFLWGPSVSDPDCMGK
jgi:hypothetical protein